jgi:DNA modification methylase
MSTFKLYNDDCLKILDTLDENSIDSVVTDPPYELGFMGKKWDSTGIAYDIELWKKVFRVLKPGGFLLSFGGTRTFHRMAVAIEDAGFEFRDTLMYIFGSGFPKSLDVSKAIDKSGAAANMHKSARIALANEITKKRKAASISREELKNWFPEYSSVTLNWERLDEGFRIPSLAAYDILIERLGIKDDWREMVRAEDLRKELSSGGVDRRNDGTIYNLAHNGKEYESTTDAAKQWQGWGTALKPAYEPIIVARKPLIGTVAQNVLEYGTGGINIDGCRVEYQNEDDKNSATPQGKCTAKSGALAGKEQHSGDRSDFERPELKGRFPANIIHDGSDEVLAGFPETKSGTLNFGQNGVYGTSNGNGEGRDYNANSGSAARFFYCAKASKKDRGEGNIHPTVKPFLLMKYLCRLVTPPNGTVLDPFMGSGSTGKAAMLEGFNFIGIELEKEYFEISEKRIKAEHSEFISYE